MDAKQDNGNKNQSHGRTGFATPLAELALARAQIDIAKDLTADLPTLLSKGQVAALLGIPESSVQTLHENRQLRGGVKVSKWLRWKPRDVRAFIDGLTIEN